MKKVFNFDTSQISNVEDPIQHRRKLKNNAVFISGHIKKFYDKNSTIDSSKKIFCNFENEKVQKRYLNASIVDLHPKFLAENSFSVSYATFSRYHPIYCKAPKVSERNTCACVAHENFSFLIKALHEKKF